MQSLFIEYVFLILIILWLMMFADKIGVAYPIVLVVGGLVVSFMPVFDNVTISPEVVFFLFLPPLLYEAAWQISWKEFWKWRRAIASFAFPIVIITSCVVALVSVALIPGFTLALGFLLGAIVSPPDAIAASAIMRETKAPKVLVSMAEGESLLNDATSLIIFRFALVAVITGKFHLMDASINFFTVVTMGIVVGLIMGLVFYWIHRLLPVTPSIETVLTLVTPYCMYYVAEDFHCSGVLAVVSGGLFLSSRRLRMLNYLSRIQGVNVWQSVVFILNGFVFLLIGLQLPSVIRQLGDVSLETAVWYGLAISFVLIVARILCTLGSSAFAKFLSRYMKVAQPNPGWKGPLIFGWAGIRGVVSLAAALSIPLLASPGNVFPYRNLILFITFMVILVTLVFQGLTLPWLIRKMMMNGEDRNTAEQEKDIQKKISLASLQHLEEKLSSGELQNIYLEDLKKRLKFELDFFSLEVEEAKMSSLTARSEYVETYIELLDHQRSLLEEINYTSEYDEEIIRKFQFIIDMEEYRVREKFLPGLGENRLSSVS